MPNDRPVFIVGVFRSGTSLLCSLLNQNPKIALMYECDVWNFPRTLLAHRFRRKWAERIEFYNQALSRHKLVAGNDVAALEKIRTPLDLYQAFGAMKGASVSGEKSPFYGSRLGQLHQQYPAASFILVWRDPLEIYRSVLKAAETSRFFARPGMLSRMIYHQEQIIQQAARIERAGARVFRVDYADIVDRTEPTCRALSAFLDVPFAPQMLALNRADLSAIYKAPHHAYLRRGVIARQKFTQELVPPATARQLGRFRRRWEQKQAGGGRAAADSESALPGATEFFYHNIAGKLLTVYDSLVRAAFEFLPLPWLRVYRLLKAWVVNPPTGEVDEKMSLARDWQRHWPTLLTAAGLFATVVLIHRHSNPHLIFILFYAVPCALVALVVNNRWASLFVLLSSVIPPIIQFDGDKDYQSPGVFVWNFFSRFVLLEILILTIGRIRLEFLRQENAEK